MPEEKFSVRYPLQSRSFMKGTNPASLPRKGAIPYNPIFSIPPEDMDYRWEFSRQDTEQLLYNKVNEICNLTDFLFKRNVLHLDCQTVPVFTYEDILKKYNYLNNFKAGIWDNKYRDKIPYYSMEAARCTLIADAIRHNCLEKYGPRMYNPPIYSYTFRRYFTMDEWQYFYMAPIQSIMFRNVDADIHTAFHLFQTLITYNLDPMGKPYIEVLISNRILPNNVEESLRRYTLSRYSRDNMEPVIESLGLAIASGISKGRREVINTCVTTDTRLVNSLEDYKLIAKPSIAHIQEVGPELQSCYDKAMEIVKKQESKKYNKKRQIHYKPKKRKAPKFY